MKRDNWDTQYDVKSGAKTLAEYNGGGFLEAEYVYAGDQMLATLKTKKEVNRLPVNLKVKSRGYKTSGSWAKFYIDGVHYEPTSCGYHLIEVDENTGEYLDDCEFITWTSNPNYEPDPQDMIDFIDNIPTGRIVLVAVREDGWHGMTEAAYLALESLGSRYCRNVEIRDSHAMIGVKGAIPGTVIERHILKYGDEAVCELHIADCEVYSAGKNDGNFATFKVDNNTITVSGYNTGFNIVVVNEETGSVLDTENFNPWNDSNAPDNMAHFINVLPVGRIVMVGIKDDGSYLMNENAYLALESIGVACRDIAMRDSWAIIGVKGAAPGTVTEKRVPRYGGTASIISEAATIYLSQPYTEGYYFFYQDHLGSTRQLSQSDMQRDYSPYGEVVTAAGNDETAYQFSGKEKDLATGFSYFGARYYYPGIGRWLVPDPAGQGWSPYVFACNSPVMYIDENGEWAFLVPILMGAVKGAAISAGFYTATEFIEHGSKMGGRNFWEGFGKAAAMGAITGAVAGGVNFLGSEQGYGWANSSNINAKYGFKIGKNVASTLASKTAKSWVKDEVWKIDWEKDFINTYKDLASFAFEHGSEQGWWDPLKNSKAGQYEKLGGSVLKKVGLENMGNKLIDVSHKVNSFDYRNYLSKPQLNGLYTLGYGILMSNENFLLDNKFMKRLMPSGSGGVIKPLKIIHSLTYQGDQGDWRSMTTDWLREGGNPLRKYVSNHF